MVIADSMEFALCIDEVRQCSCVHRACEDHLGKSINSLAPLAVQQIRFQVDLKRKKKKASTKIGFRFAIWQRMCSSSC